MTAKSLLTTQFSVIFFRPGNNQNYGYKTANPCNHWVTTNAAAK